MNDEDFNCVEQPDVDRKMSLIEGLRNRRKWQGNRSKDLSCVADQEPTDVEKRTAKHKKGRKNLPFFRGKQVASATKEDRAIVVGFCICNPHEGSKLNYRQVRAPMGGGIRHLRVNRNTKKVEWNAMISSLFFPDGRSCHGRIEEYLVDIGTDVHGTQLMRENETVEDIIKRLGLKHLRCYLLARKLKSDSSDSLESLPEMIPSPCSNRQIAADVATNDVQVDSGVQVTQSMLVLNEGKVLMSEQCDSEQISIDILTPGCGQDVAGVPCMSEATATEPGPSVSQLEPVDIPNIYLVEDYLARECPIYPHNLSNKNVESRWTPRTC